MVFIFRQADAAAGLSPSAQFTTDQFATWTIATQGIGGVTVATDPDGFGTGVDKISVRIPWTPAVSPSIFARLRVSSTP